MSMGVFCENGRAGHSAPLMSSVAARWAPPPPLLRYAEHPTVPFWIRRGHLVAKNFLGISSAAAPAFLGGSS